MKNELLRHAIATIDYRFTKVVQGQEDGFGNFSLGTGSRTTNQIINHMFDVLYSTRIFMEEERRVTGHPTVLSFADEVTRFKREVEHLDASLSKVELPVNYGKRLIQGPISDVFTHIGQLSMMSRLNGKPKDGEDFSRAPIGTFANPG